MNTQIQINEKAVTRMSSSKLLDKRAELLRIVEEAQDVLTGVNNELMTRVEADGTEGKLTVGRSTISIISRPVFKGIELKTAIRLNATKLVADTTKLAALMKAGKKVKGVTMTSYISVR